MRTDEVEANLDGACALSQESDLCSGILLGGHPRKQTLPAAGERTSQELE